MIKNDLLDSGMKEDMEVLGIAGGEKIGSSASETMLVKDCATKLGTRKVVVGVSVEGRDSGL